MPELIWLGIYRLLKLLLKIIFLSNYKFVLFNLILKSFDNFTIFFNLPHKSMNFFFMTFIVLFHRGTLTFQSRVFLFQSFILFLNDLNLLFHSHNLKPILLMFLHQLFLSKRIYRWIIQLLFFSYLIFPLFFEWINLFFVCSMLRVAWYHSRTNQWLTKNWLRSPHTTLHLSATHFSRTKIVLIETVRTWWQHFRHIGHIFIGFILLIHEMIDIWAFDRRFRAILVHMHKLDLCSNIFTAFQRYNCLKLLIRRFGMRVKVDKTSRNHTIGRNHHHH